MIKLDRIERNHFFKLFYSLGTILKEMIGIIFASGFLIKWIGFRLGILTAVILLILLLAYEIIEWRKNIFIIREKYIYHKEGVFSVKKIEVPLEKINTVDISTNFFEQIFNVATIKIDTGDAKDHGNELKFTLNRGRAEAIRNILLKENRDTLKNKYEQESYSLGSKELFIYSIISNSLFKGLAILLAIQQFFEERVKKLLKLNIDTSKYFRGFHYVTFYEKIYIIVIIVCIILFVSLCLSIIYNFIKYYNFRMWADNNKICINYGALNKKNYSFDREKIKGIHLKQSVLMQVFGYFTIEIESIGYGDEKGEKAILYPICNSQLKDRILKDLLNEFLYEDNFNKPLSNVYFGFFYKKIIFWIIVTWIIAFTKPSFILFSIVMFIILFIIGHMEFKNTALGINRNLVCICHNSFNKTQSLLKMSTIQSVTLSYNYFQHNKGVCNYKFILYSSNYGKELKVKNLKDNIIETFLK
ncbi:PH domain-containing protein [Clostridium coskatii]|uniref:Bacterial membrane flanked domain protein n=1 Tax=Clostridium coskatii TaxID=1705578 RepID=A0A166UHJ5_9CLOT|nr:PH domain-containing protein [Clostridium coskatii]OAA94928.1 Bacterial membrane flanked domain protein [Clostridium coskatii]OBR91669.1 bacterial membrane flanked domain protein [Clostridium coskatii]